MSNPELPISISEYTDFQDITLDFQCTLDFDVFPIVYTTRPLKLVSLEKKNELPEYEELFSGEFSLLPISKDDLEEKHIIGIADRIICATATWLLGKSSLHEALSSCLYMPLKYPLEQDNELGMYLLLFVEGIRRGCDHLCKLVGEYNKIYQEDLIEENNPFPPLVWEEYENDFKSSIDKLSVKENPSDFDKAILSRLKFSQKFDLLCSIVYEKDRNKILDFRKEITSKWTEELKILKEHDILGEEPIGSFSPSSVNYLTLDSHSQLVSFDEAVNTFTEYFNAVSKALDLIENDFVKLSYAVLQYFSDINQLTFLRPIVVSIVRIAILNENNLTVLSTSSKFNGSIKILLSDPKKKIDDIVEGIKQCWERTILVFCLDYGKMHDKLPQCISEWEEKRLEAKKRDLKAVILYLKHVKNFAILVYFMLGYKLRLYTPEEYRLTLWILTYLYKCMIPKALHAQEPKHSTSPEFGMKPDLAYSPPLPKDLPLKPNSAPFNQGNVLFSNTYLSYLMAQQLSIMGELTLHRGLLSNFLIREGIQKEMMEKIFTYRIFSTGDKELRTLLSFKTFSKETEFYSENFDVLYKRSIGYFEKSTDLFKKVKEMNEIFSEIPSLTEMMSTNNKAISYLLTQPERGIPSFKIKNTVSFEPQETFPVLVIKPKSDTNEQNDSNKNGTEM